MEVRGETVSKSFGPVAGGGIQKLCLRIARGDKQLF